MNTHLARVGSIAVLASLVACGVEDPGGTDVEADDDVVLEQEDTEDLGTAEQNICWWSVNPPTSFDDTGTLTYANGYELLQGEADGGCDRHTTRINLNTQIHTLQITSDGLLPCRPDYSVWVWARKSVNGTPTYTKLSFNAVPAGGTIWDPVCYIDGTYTFASNNTYDQIITSTWIDDQAPTINVYAVRY